MLECPHCGIRQYTAASCLELPRCVVCDGPLDLPISPGQALTGDREPE
jgi:hypothetical protein